MPALTPDPIRVWRVEARIPFPVGIAAVEAADEPGALPARIGPTSRVPRGSAEINGLVYELSVAHAPAPTSDPLFSPESARVVVRAQASSAWEAASVIQPGLERILENLAFQMQVVLIPAELEVLDVTPPVAPGDDREVAVYADGEPLAAFRRLRDLGAPAGLASGDLRVAAEGIPAPLSAAQRWYIKSLATPFEHDQFIFLWIALETLWEASGIQVTRPLKHGDHTIPTCPVCGESNPEGSRAEASWST